MGVVVGVIVLAFAYGTWRFGVWADGRTVVENPPIKQRIAAIGLGILAAIAYLVVVTCATAGILLINIGLIGAVGKFAGWSTKTVASAASGLTLIIVVLTIGVYVLSGFWRGYLRHLLPGSARGSVTVEPNQGSALESTKIRKRWACAERLDPFAMPVGVAIASQAFGWNLADNATYAKGIVVVLAGGAIATAPRIWRVLQYTRRKSVRRTNSADASPNDDVLFEVLLPRSIFTPVFVGVLASVVVRHLPPAVDWWPLGALAGAAVYFAMVFPLTMEPISAGEPVR